MNGLLESVSCVVKVHVHMAIGHSGPTVHEGSESPRNASSTVVILLCDAWHIQLISGIGSHRVGTFLTNPLLIGSAIEIKALIKVSDLLSEKAVVKLDGFVVLFVYPSGESMFCS
jgi:hypothetical protein